MNLRGYQPRNNLVKDENGDLLADSHIFNRWKNYFSQLLNVHNISGVFNFALEYAIRRVQQNQVRLKLNGTDHLLSYADDMNLLGDNIHTIKKNKETLTDASKELGL
jgi:hypothetical protein